MSKDTAKVFEYKDERQGRIHKALLETKKYYMNEEWFLKNEKDLSVKFKDFNNFDYYANIYLWETFFKYDESILKYIVATSKKISDNNKSASPAEKLILFFFHCMTISPADAPAKEEKPKEPRKEKRPELLTLEMVLEGL